MSGEELRGGLTVPDHASWHDVECGAYSADLPLWGRLAATYGDPVLEVGAGTGRVALDLARRGHEVTALDRDPVLIDVLRSRGQALGVEAVVADAQSFHLDRRFGLIVVPMQTIQLLAGAAERIRFLGCARTHLASGGALAVAITEHLELYETGPSGLALIPDMLERDGILYASTPVAIRRIDDGFLLERRRERVSPGGRREAGIELIRLAALSAEELEDEAAKAGLKPAARHEVGPTPDHVGSLVVVLSA